MPTRTIVAGTWQLQTNAPADNTGKSVDITGVYPVSTKIDTMIRVVTDFYNDAATLLPATATNPFYIFVAPEYYFKRTIDQRCLTGDQRDEVRTAMSRLAVSLPNLLLIPGTIMWKKAMDRKSHDKASQRLATNLTVNPTYVGNTALPDRPGRFNLFGKTSYFAYNTAYLYEGSNIWKYHKMNDVGELMATETTRTMFIPGEGTNIYNISGMRIGIEICGDHAGGMIASEVDIHIVTSAPVDRADSKVRAKDGGLFIRANTNNAEITYVDRTATTPFTPVAPAAVTRPRIADKATERAEFQRRYDFSEKGYIKDAAGDNAKLQRHRDNLKLKVKQAFGGKLTTAIMDIDV